MPGRSLKDIERQIEALQAEAGELRLAEGIEQLRAVIREYGVGLAHFKIALEANRKRGRAPSKRPPAYRNPTNDAETWTGRGRKPRWLVAALKAGRTVEQCKIEPSAQPDAMEIH